MTIATSESWRDKATGELREKTEWHRVVVYDGLTELVQNQLRKGSQVDIEGQLHTRKWKNSNQQLQETTEVLVQTGQGIVFELLSNVVYGGHAVAC